MALRETPYLGRIPHLDAINVPVGELGVVRRVPGVVEYHDLRSGAAAGWQNDLS
jgi:hypothetical protein